VDIEKASSGAVKGRFVNNGQSCIATKRFVVVKKIANEFIEKFVQKTVKQHQKARCGRPDFTTRLFFLQEVHFFC
jgi:acyl-CoA reductase-like NAD-dependent aldehyde dehydrogenase